jgi:hypothetical protein
LGRAVENNTRCQLGALAGDDDGIAAALADPDQRDASRIDPRVTLEHLEGVADHSGNLIVGELHACFPAPEGLLIAVPAGEKIRGQCDQAIAGGLRREVEGVVNKAIALVEDHHRAG